MKLFLMKLFLMKGFICLKRKIRLFIRFDFDSKKERLMPKRVHWCLKSPKPQSLKIRNLKIRGSTESQNPEKSRNPESFDSRLLQIVFFRRTHFYETDEWIILNEWSSPRPFDLNIYELIWRYSFKLQNLSC